MNPMTWAQLSFPDPIAAQPVWLILGTVLIFLVTLYACDPVVWARFFLEKGFAADTAQGAGVLASKFLGGGWMFAASLVLVRMLELPLGFTGLRVPDALNAFGVGLGLAVVVVPIASLGARKPSVRALYPEIRMQPFPREWRLMSAFGWFVYLLGYELLFRGVLLNPLVHQFGPWVALTIMTGLYVLAHIHKPMPECIATIPMGYVFGLMALTTGGILAPFVLHWLVAVANENVAAGPLTAKE